MEKVKAIQTFLLNTNVQVCFGNWFTLAKNYVKVVFPTQIGDSIKAFKSDCSQIYKAF